MSRKIIVTERQHALIINQVLKEMVERNAEINYKNRLNEGFWDNIKYGLSKLGRYKAGGKILGKGKVDQEYAEKIKKIIEKEGNEMIRQLDAQIKESNPEFPNNKDPQQFLTTVMAIAAVYDSIVAATQKQEKEEGYMPIDAANLIIADLREYTNKYLDVDLKAVYSGFDENEDDSDDVISEQGEAAPAAAAPADDEEEAEQSPEDVRSQLQAKRGEEDSEDFASTRMDTLKSNKLPLILAGVGASLGALGWMAQTEWFKHLLEELLGSTKTITSTDTIIHDVVSSPNDGSGFVSWAGKIMGKPMNTGADLQQFISKHGAEQVSHMFDGNGGGDSMGQIQKLQQLIKANPNANMGDIFKTAKQTFGSMQGGQNLFGVSKSANFFVRTVTKQITKTVVKGAGTAVAAKVAGLSGILTGVGIALVTTGVLVKLVRMKGQKSSRAATLNALYQSMRDIKGGTGVIAPTGDEQDDSIQAKRDAVFAKYGAKGLAALDAKIAARGGAIGGAGAGGAGAGAEAGGETGEKTNTDNLYNHLKSLFQFIVNNKKTMGTKTQYDTGRAPAPASKPKAQAPLTEGKYIKDKRVLQYLDKNLSLDKVKNFEDLLNRVEMIRNVAKKMSGKTGDKNLDKLIGQLNSNPIMLTNFAELTKVDPSNPQDIQSLLGFIKETLLSIYSGSHDKVTGLIDKMATLGGGNINKLTEEAGYSALEPNKLFMKDAQSKTSFKKNLTNFLNSLMSIFQYLHKQKGGQIARKDTTNKYTKPPRRAKQGGAPSAAPAAGQAAPTGQAAPRGPSSPTGQNVVPEWVNERIMEEITRMKKIMFN